MLTIRDHQTGDLFDRWAFLGTKRRELLERSWASVFRQHLLANLPVEKLAPYFKSDDGRPTKDLHVALGVLILQQMFDLTDTRTVEAMAFDTAWHFALDLRADSDAYFCERTLRNYRHTVIALSLDAVLFKGLTDQLIMAYGVDTTKQRLDSTALRSAMRNLTRLGCVVETVSKFLRELARTHPDLHAQADPETIRRYVEREGAGCFALATPSESKRRLPEAGLDLANLVFQYRPTAARELPSFALLERVLTEQFEIAPDDGGSSSRKVRVKEPDEIPCDNVRNPADPDSSYNTYRGQGYLAQFMETYQEDDATPMAGEEVLPAKPDLITHVAVNKMTQHDCDALEPALADAKDRDIQPQRLLGDTHYGPQENIQKAAGLGTAVIAPAQTPRGENAGRLTLEQFELNEQGEVLKCPGGQTPESVSSGAERMQARFDATICERCPLKTSCLIAPELKRGKKVARIQYTRERVATRERRLAERSDEFKEKYRWRAGIEGTMSRLKHQMGLNNLRVRGRKAVRYVVNMRALGLNILRCKACKAA